MREVKFQHVLQDHVDGQVLGHKICTVALAWDFREGGDFLLASFLKPKAVHIDVTHLCYPLAIEDPFGSRCIELEGNPDIRTHVQAEGLDPRPSQAPRTTP